METDKDSEDEGTEGDVVSTRGSSSGPNTGPLKNLEYRPCFAASLLAVARSDRRLVAPASTLGFGVVLPDVEAGVPEMGRRLEMMPVVVRWRGTDPGSCESNMSRTNARGDENKVLRCH